MKLGSTEGMPGFATVGKLLGVMLGPELGESVLIVGTSLGKELGSIDGTPE